MSVVRREFGKVRLLEWSALNSSPLGVGMFNSYGGADLGKEAIAVLKFVDGELVVRNTEWKKINTHPASTYLGLVAFITEKKGELDLLMLGDKPIVLDVAALGLLLSLAHARSMVEEEEFDGLVSKAWELATTAGYLRGIWNPYVFIATVAVDTGRKAMSDLTYSDWKSIRDFKDHIKVLEGFLADMPPDAKPDRDDDTSLFGQFLACSWVAYLLAMTDYGSDDMGDYLPATSIMKGKVEFDGKQVIVIDETLGEPYEFKFKRPSFYEKWTDLMLGEGDELARIPTYTLKLDKAELRAFDYARMVFHRRFGMAIERGGYLKLTT